MYEKNIKILYYRILFGVIVDFTTTSAAKNPVFYYLTYMPVLLIFYIESPLIFSLLIYKFNINNVILFIAILIEAFIVEVIFSRNTLLISFPLMLICITAAISIYSFIIYVPKWIVDK